MLERFLFESKLGEMLLAALERSTGLAVIRATDLADQHSGLPTAQEA